MRRGARAAVGSTPGPGQGPGGTFPVNGERRPRASIQSGRETMLGPRVVHYSLPLSRGRGRGRRKAALSSLAAALRSLFFPSPSPPSLPSRRRITEFLFQFARSGELNLLSLLLGTCSQCLYLLIIFYFVIVIIVIIIIRWLLWASKFDDVLSTDIAFRILRLTNTHSHTHTLLLYT